MLKGVCQFRVNDYLDRPANLSSTSKSPTSLLLRWSTAGLRWLPSLFSVRACHLRGLSAASLPVNEEEKCRERNVSKDEREERGSRIWTVEVDDLRDFSEYQVVVEGTLDGFKDTKMIQIKSRTREFSENMLLMSLLSELQPSIFFSAED